jgi:O-methyltransferase
MNFLRMKRTIVNLIPKQLSFLYLFNPKDISSVLAFLFKPRPKTSFQQRLFIVRKLCAISHAITCQHSQNQIISFIKVILSVPDYIHGCIVEASCYQGGSTAKFSIAAKIANRELVVFDSFEGLPMHNEPLDKGVPGWHARPPGSFSASLNEVISNVDRYGKLEVCEFIKGWFDDTMPKFSRQVAAAYLDVNLASSTRTCLKYLYPLLAAGSTLLSDDGYSPLICDVFSNDEFWQKEVGYPKPHVEGLGKQKVIKIVKSIEFKKADSLKARYAT